MASLGGVVRQEQDPVPLCRQRRPLYRRISACLSLSALQILPSPELFQHDHLVLTHLRGDLQKSVLLLVLRQVDNVSPALLILGLEVSEEFIK